MIFKIKGDDFYDVESSLTSTYQKIKDNPEETVIDITECRLVGSRAIGVLISIKSLLVSNGFSFEVIANERNFKILQVCNIDKMIDVREVQCGCE